MRKIWMRTLFGKRWIHNNIYRTSSSSSSSNTCIQPRLTRPQGFHVIDLMSLLFSYHFRQHTYTLNDKPYKWNTWYFMHKWIDCINGFDLILFPSWFQISYSLQGTAKYVVDSVTGRCWLFMVVSPIFLGGIDDECQNIAYHFNNFIHNSMKKKLLCL